MKYIFILLEMLAMGKDCWMCFRGEFFISENQGHFPYFGLFDLVYEQNQLIG